MPRGFDTYSINRIDHEFKVARGLLSQSVSALGSLVQSNDKNAIKDAVEAVHTNYQALEKIF